MAKFQLEITSNGGYGADQVEAMTVAELRTLLEDFEDSDEIVLHDEGNRYGASFGYLHGDYQECEEEEEDDTEE